MKALPIVFLCLLAPACSVKKFYPLGGAVAGGAAGSIGGPVSAGLAAGAGWTIGELAKGDAELESAKQTIQALTSGDVEKLIELKAVEQQSWFDKVVGGIYDLLMITAIGAVLIIVVPILYTKFHIKKLKNEK